MTPTAPRPSATICLLRDGPQGLEVLMGQRSASAKFMAKAWVFPGGRVEETDEERAAELVVGDNEADQLPWIVAALRETVEEAGIWLTDPPRSEVLGDRSVYDVLDTSSETFVVKACYFANWVTPADMPIRYDARFFACEVVEGLPPIPDGQEIDLAEWVRPGEAILRAAQHEWLVPFPTHVILEQLAKARSATAFMDLAENEAVNTVKPRIRIEDDGSLRVVLPGEPGFDELPVEGSGPEELAAAARRAQQSGNPIPEIE
ncbi:MAG: NUDIX domain-containing protein [bacterium]|nr:NUDIX domain-containing protein [bacterium]